MRSPRFLPRVSPLAIAGALLAGTFTLGTPAAHADVSQPSGGKLFLEAGSPTGIPGHAITDGVWGREGPQHDLGTFVDPDLSDSSDKVSDASQAFWLKRFGVDDFNKLGIAFVRASADGSTERPAVTKGENAGEAFQWWADTGPTTGWTSTGKKWTDFITVIHTLPEYRAWVKDDKPAQVYDDKLVAHDAVRTGTPVSAHPSGRSIDNRWASGQKLSLVVFAIDGYDATGIPLVAADSTGHAETAWLTFRTEADPADPTVRTSGAYHVISASPLPKTPDEVSSDPAAEVNGTSASGVPSGGASASATSSAPTGSAAGDDSSTEAAGGSGDDGSAGVGTLWTGSGWAWPVLAVLLSLGVLVSGVVLFRFRPDETP